MMDFKEFKEQLRQDLEQELADQNGLQISETQVEKMQGQSYTALTVSPQESGIGMNLNVEHLFDRLQEGTEYPTIFNQAMDQVMDFVDHAPQFDIHNVMDYEQARTHLFAEVVGVERNAEMLQKVPHVQVEDMALVYRIQVGQAGDGIASTLVTNNLMDHLGVSQEQLHQDALKSSAEIMPAQMQKLSEVIAEMTGMPTEALEGSVPPLYVLSNEEKVKGASALFYPDMMESCTREMGGDYYVLPSSVHEVLLLADDGSMRSAELKDMVSSINGEVVEPADVLTDQVYHYDAKDRIFELGEKFEARQAEKEAGREGRTSVLKDLKDKQQEVSSIPKSVDVRTAAAPEL